MKQVVPAPESPQSTPTPRRILERHFCPDCVPLGKPNDAVVQAAAAEVALGGLAAVWNPWIGGVLAAVGVFRIGIRVVAGRRRRRSTAPPAALFLDPRITKLELTETLRGTVVRRAGRSETSVTDVSGTVTMEAVWSRAHTAAVADHRRKLGLSASDEVEFSAGSLIVSGPGRLELPASPVPRPAGTTIPMLLALRSRASDHAVLAHAAGRGDPRWTHITAYTVDARGPDAPAPVWVTAALAPGSGGRALELDVQWCFTDPLDSAAKRAAAPQAERIEQLQLSVPGAWGEVENVGVRKTERVRRPPVADPPSVFVSHRSSDSAWFLHVVVDHLRRALRPHPVFADTGLRAGQVWPEELDAELRRCAAVVALIGPNWRSASAVLQREIRTALERKVLLVPVLFDGATMNQTRQSAGNVQLPNGEPLRDGHC